MKTNYLFPHKFKTISGILFIVATLVMFYLLLIDDSEIINLDTTVFAVMNDDIFGKMKYFEFIPNDIFDELLISVFVISGLVFAFSKEKIEDEMTAKIRLESLVWSTYVNYLLFFLCVWFVYGSIIYTVMMIALFTHLLFFIIRFNWKLYTFKHSADHEE
ncbi:hypothetical protein [Flavobacterium suzhouense]|uniref:Uncharacterized protein n=1 Tax=Flavobacterium suzhouense TaxID=1529638 RepID=A0ABW5NU94_9FLAO